MRLRRGVLLSALILATACAPGRTRVASPSAPAGTPPAGPVAPAAEPETAPAVPPEADAGADQDARAEAGIFPTSVLPILRERCSPCHFEGGVMYAKLPFDDPETIRMLGTRLFTRIRDPEDQARIREFLRTASPEEPARSR